MTSLADRAARLLELHVPGDPAVLPTVWDAWSAQTAADSGFKGLTVGSHPVADSLGVDDGEAIRFEDLLLRLGQVTSVVDVPVSADVEAGYGQPAEKLIDGLLSVGVVGLNIEDTVHSEGGRLREPTEHATLIGALRAAADRAGVPVVINARTDLLKRDGEEGTVTEAINRLRLCAEAGADVLYAVPRLGDDVIARLVAELPKPLNAVADPTKDKLRTLANLGVARISFGPFLQAALTDGMANLLTPWR